MQVPYDKEINVKEIYQNKISCYLLEVVSLVLVAKEGYSIGHHPNVSPSTVEVGFRPMAVLVQDLNTILPDHPSVGRVVMSVHGPACKIENTEG